MDTLRNATGWTRVTDKLRWKTRQKHVTQRWFSALKVSYAVIYVTVASFSVQKTGSTTSICLKMYTWFRWLCFSRFLWALIHKTKRSLCFQNLQKNENISLLHFKRKNIICLNSHRYFEVHCLYCLITFEQKYNVSVSRLLESPSQPLFCLVTQRPLVPRRREMEPLRDETK